MNRYNLIAILLMPVMLALIIAIVILFFATSNNFKKSLSQLDQISKLESTINTIYFEESRLNQFVIDSFAQYDMPKMEVMLHLNSRRTIEQQLESIAPLDIDPQVQRLTNELLDLKRQKDALEREMYEGLAKGTYDIHLDYAIFDVQSRQFSNIVKKLRSRIADLVKERSEKNVMYTRWTEQVGTLLAITSSVAFSFMAFLFFLLARSKNKIDAANHSIDKKNNELEQVNDELSQFAYRTSHDLKSPLISIQGLGRALKEDINENDFSQVHFVVDKIVEQAAKLEALVNDILDLARADLQYKEKETFVVDDVFTEIKGRLESLANKQGVVVKSNIRIDRMLLCEKVRLIQVLENLLSNGIKYCNKNKNYRFVQLVIEENRGSLIMTISDNGVGIPADYQSKIFEMFERFHPNLSFGSGLGLYIVKKHLDKMGFTIQMNSTEQGSRFIIKAPSTDHGDYYEL